MLDHYLNIGAINSLNEQHGNSSKLLRKRGKKWDDSETIKYRGKKQSEAKKEVRA